MTVWVCTQLYHLLHYLGQVTITSFHLSFLISLVLHKAAVNISEFTVPCLL